MDTRIRPIVGTGYAVELFPETNGAAARVAASLGIRARVEAASAP